MICKPILISLVLIAGLFQSHAQTDSVNKPQGNFKQTVKKFIVPASLLTAGLLINKSKLEHSIRKEVRSATGEDFHTSIDNYTRYVPIAQMYIADMVGIPAKNHWFDQSKNLTITIIMTDLITTRLKRATKKQRPQGGTELESFPSAHTSLAFATATVLYEEFRESSPWLANSGFMFAGATGIMRIMNDQHWTSDVLFGAGVGILVGKIVYLFDPLIKWNPFKGSDKIRLIPVATPGDYGMYFSYQF